MTANFILYQNYALHAEGRHLDLHNNYDFQRFAFDIEQRQFSLHWKSTEAGWVPADNPASITLTIYEVEFLLVTPCDYGSPVSDSLCLAELTYYPSSARQESESIIEQEQPGDNDDLILRFADERVIRVNGSRVELNID